MLARALASPDQAFGSFFLSRLFGLVVSYGADTCFVRFSADPALGNPQGSLHGGVMATAMDISMGHLLHHRLGAGTTLEMKIQFLSTAKAGWLTAEGRFLRQGRSISFLESRLTSEDGSVIAVATSTWKLLRPREPSQP